jgi:hypothetical protein
MFARAAFVAALVASMSLIGETGEIKGHSWPTMSARQDFPIAEIPVVMDIQSFVRISSGAIKLAPVGPQTYEGQRDLRVLCNFPLSVECSIIPTGAVGGQYACSIANPHVDPPGGVVKLCVRLTEAHLGNQPPRNNVTVAVVKVTVVPRS